jgi:hypothetical protein
VSQQINLFNPVLLRQKKYFSAITMMQALALILLGSLLVALYASFRLSGLQSAADQSSARLAAAQAQQARAMAEFGVRQSNPLLATEFKKTSSEVQALQQVFDILQTGEIGNTDGYSAYLTAFARQITDGLWLTGFAIHGAGNEIALQGRMLRPELVPAYISRLTREPVMHGKSFSTLVMQQPQAEGASTGATASAAAGAPPANGYLEFRLQSAGIAPDVADTARSKLK